MSTSHHHAFSPGVATPTWFGTMSTSTPMPEPPGLGREGGEPLGPAARAVDAVEGDHVVAVGLPGSAASSGER